jgi:predicted AlkP superfamily phosphohydrolase/phosphomutase
MKRRVGSYEMSPTSTLDIKGETLADIVSRHGKRVALVNVPMTYPPRPLNGLVVTGLDTPSVTSPFTFPAELQKELRARFDYEVEPLVTITEGTEQAFLDQVLEIEDKRAAAALDLLRREDWDLFSVVFRGTDLLSHYFWRAQDPTHPGYDPSFAQRYGHVLRDHYAHMDGVVGRLVEAAGDDAVVIVMSDHGSGPIWRHVYLDNWLLRSGFMRVKQTADARLRYFLLERGITISSVLNFLKRIGLWRWVRRFMGRETRLKITGRVFGSAAIDWGATLAYPVGIVGAINVNLKGREPEGAVEPGAEYDQVRQRVREALLQLRDPETQQPLVSRVLYKEEVYSGAEVDAAPDLVIVWRDHAYKSTFILGSSNQIVSPVLTTYSGFHTMDGMVVISGPGVRRGVEIQGAGIIDMAPTILALLGLPIPNDMDGQVLEEAMERDLGVAYESAQSATATTDEELFTSDEEAMVTERLKGLGYL